MFFKVDVAGLRELLIVKNSLPHKHMTKGPKQKTLLPLRDRTSSQIRMTLVP